VHFDGHEDSPTTFWIVVAAATLFAAYGFYRAEGSKALLRVIKKIASNTVSAVLALLIVVGGGAAGFWLLLEGLESTGIGIFDGISVLFPLRSDGEWLKGWLAEENGIWGGLSGFMILIGLLHLAGGWLLALGALWTVLRNKFGPEEDTEEVGHVSNGGL
jgi:small neutral amino acid transporter SnatA (MarC family)